MQSVSSRIWTRVAMSISYDDNHYTTGTFIQMFIIHVDYSSIIILVSKQQKISKWINK